MASRFLDGVDPTGARPRQIAEIVAKVHRVSNAGRRHGLAPSPRHAGLVTSPDDCARSMRSAAASQHNRALTSMPLRGGWSVYRPSRTHPPHQLGPGHSFTSRRPPACGHRRRRRRHPEDHASGGVQITDSPRPHVRLSTRPSAGAPSIAWTHRAACRVGIERPGRSPNRAGILLGCRADADEVGSARLLISSRCARKRMPALSRLFAIMPATWSCRHRSALYQKRALAGRDLGSIRAHPA